MSGSLRQWGKDQAFDIDPWTVITTDGKVPMNHKGQVEWVNGKEAAEREATMLGGLPVSIALLEAFYVEWIESGDYDLDKGEARP